MAMSSYEYYKKTGEKFTGTEEEFEILHSGCDKQLAWTDEEGYFDKFLCMKDFNECDFNCQRHQRKREINPDIKQFFDNCLNFEKR